MDINNLLYRIDGFVEGRDRSILNVQTIEAVLRENFVGNEEIEEIASALSMFTPGGGEYLLNEQDLVRPLRWARKILGIV